MQNFIFESNIWNKVKFLSMVLNELQYNYNDMNNCKILIKKAVQFQNIV